MAGQLPHDDGNFVTGSISQIDCHNTTLWSSANGTHLVGLGLKDVVTVVMDDAVLVADAARMQDVRGVVDYMETARSLAIGMPRITGPGAGSKPRQSTRLSGETPACASGCLLILTKPSASVRALGSCVWHCKGRPR